LSRLICLHKLKSGRIRIINYWQHLKANSQFNSFFCLAKLYLRINDLLARHMKKVILSLILFISLINICFSQNDIPVRTLPTEVFRTIAKPVDTTKWRWKRGGIANFNMAQGTQKNWAAGGDNFSIALTSYVNYYIFYKYKKQTWDNNLDFNIGYIDASTIGARKNDDRLDFLSKYGFSIDTVKKLYLSSLFNFRTQFFDGFNYNNGPPGIFSSTFLSPAYVLLSVGFDYKPTKDLSIFLSAITNRTTFVVNETLAKEAAYGVDTGRHVFNQFGAFASINYIHSFGKNITYKGRMDLFSNYAQNPQNIDFYMTNFLNFKITKYFSATYNLNLIYDDNVRQFGPNGTSPGLQVQSQIGLGFSLPFTVVKHT